MRIKQAEESQFQAVRAFYHDVIDAVGDSRDSVGWKKDVYPAPDLLREAIRGGELFLMEDTGTIVGAMVLNHQFNGAYKAAAWSVQAEAAEVTGIHALAIHPSHRGKGCARQLVQFAVDHARSHRQKAIRLDVLKGNQAAGRLYAGMGFRYRQTVPMFYEDTGWTDFDLYELPL